MGTVCPLFRTYARREMTRQDEQIIALHDEGLTNKEVVPFCFVNDFFVRRVLSRGAHAKIGSANH